MDKVNLKRDSQTKNILAIRQESLKLRVRDRHEKPEAGGIEGGRTCNREPGPAFFKRETPRFFFPCATGLSSC